jgi:hypothetical protein
LVHALLVCLLFAAPSAAVLMPPAARFADVELKFQRGQVAVTAVKLGRFEQPTALRRFRGRFAARVLAGKKIVDEVQFDFPLLAAAESSDVDEANRALAERLRAGVTATTRVRVPIWDGADGLEIYDAQTRRVLAVALKDSPAAPAAANPRAP